MKRMKKWIMPVLSALLLLSSCGTTETVPLTGRKQKISTSLSNAQLLSLGNQEYSKFMSTAKKSTNAANSAMVQRVGLRLSKVVTNYLKTHGYAELAGAFQWEYNLVQGKEANAWCLPGGKIVVYEGLLPYTQNENALAIVLGHEISHAVAKHSAEQLTKQMNQQVGLQVVGTAAKMVGGTAGSIATTATSVAGNIAFPLMNLNYSRKDESEADYMGLLFAAMAGYDPREAIPFWQRMSGNSRNTSDFLSTHPSGPKRIAALQEHMPSAMQYYEAATGKRVTSSTPAAKKQSGRNTPQSVSASGLYKTVKKK